jgi:hypothetical protein
MAINLTSYSGLRAATFVRISVTDYRTTPTGSYTPTVLTFSDHNSAFTIDSDTYTPLGNLLGISDTSSELRQTNQDINITLSGIPNDNLGEVLYSKLKGSEVQVYRAYFTQAGAQIGSTQGRWQGTVNNYNLDEEYEVLQTTATNTVQINCISSYNLLARKVAGLKTNPNSMKTYSALDTSFDRVPSLIGSQFDFGVQR